MERLDEKYGKEKVSLPYACYNYGAGRKQHFFVKKVDLR
jgi:hypothetical protein